MEAGTPGTEYSWTGGAGPGERELPQTSLGVREGNPHCHRASDADGVKTPPPRRPAAPHPPRVPCGASQAWARPTTAGAASCGSGPPVPSRCGWGCLTEPARCTSVSSPVPGSAGHPMRPCRTRVLCQRGRDDSSGQAVASAGFPTYWAHVLGVRVGLEVRNLMFPSGPRHVHLAQCECLTQLRDVPVFEDLLLYSLCASHQLHQGLSDGAVLCPKCWLCFGRDLKGHGDCALFHRRHC